ncbi:MAG: RepB family plasmid replication initiator protein, partial [Varibaculum cambriense]|nr:RepB family plasmid replication initiator protein [Varibaculum cambriense]
ATRLYELLIAWREVGKVPQIEIGDFRNRLGLLESEYTAMSDFKKRVLEPSIKQINDHTDITVTYEQHKKGRLISGFSFRLKQKQQTKQAESKRDPDTADLFTKMTDSQRHLFGHKLAHDARVQSEYSQLVGTGSYEDFAKLLANMLAEEKHFKTFYPLLIEHGFK